MTTTITVSVLLSIALYSAVCSVTPGPNNLMLLSSGMRFGVRRTLPHMVGISLGAAVLTLMCGLGLAEMFEIYPILQTVLKWVGMGYLLWLAWGIARSGAPESAQTQEQAKPLGFWGAAAFQWVNPKAWVMSVGLISAYLPAHPSLETIVIASIALALVNFPCISVWAVAGQKLRSFLQNPRSLQWFNWTMAGLLVLSMVPAVMV